MPNEDTARHLAVKRLRDRRDFSTHLVAYLTVNAFLWILWAVTEDNKVGVPWPLWVTLGWGIGLVINAWNVYGSRPITEVDIQREMERTSDIVDPKDDS